MDLLYLINNILLIPIYLALYVVLKPAREAIVFTALILGLVGIAVYFPSNPAFEMLTLSNQYAVATTEAQQSILLAAGQALVVQIEGTAFLVYYADQPTPLVFVFPRKHSLLLGVPHLNLRCDILAALVGTSHKSEFF